MTVAQWDVSKRLYNKWGKSGMLFFLCIRYVREYFKAYISNLYILRTLLLIKIAILEKPVDHSQAVGLSSSPHMAYRHSEHICYMYSNLLWLFSFSGEWQFQLIEWEELFQFMRTKFSPSFSSQVLLLTCHGCYVLPQPDHFGNVLNEWGPIRIYNESQFIYTAHVVWYSTE